MNKISKFIVVLSIFFHGTTLAQNEAKTWYFGNNAGLSFSTNPPTVLTK